MAGYQPPFSITYRMVDLVSQIAEKTGRLDRPQGPDAKPHLRRNDRIRSIHSSLAIEANSLSIDAVRGIIDGKTVIGPEKEIQEVKNAYKAYAELGSFDPFSLAELKRLHGIMTYLTVDGAGTFRRGEEGVFADGRCIFMAPPAARVPGLMDDLFSWLRQAKADVHPLILSSVFHYEFVFIHPFADGNGRMARLWQTSLLCQWNPIFRYMPLESRVHAFQAEYYAAIAKCHSEGSADRFVLFMLEKINETLMLYLQQTEPEEAQGDAYVQRLLAVMEHGTPYTAKRIMELLHLRSKETLRKHYIGPALALGLVVMTQPQKPTSRNQAYLRR